MSLAASTSAGRGHITLQPSFFTSSLYVNSFRDDIRNLIHAYHEQYSQSSEKPFALFKAVWRAQGWEWLHFKVYDNPSREALMNVSHRLLLERSMKTEAPFTRVVALFGLYTFFSTQPSSSAYPLTDFIRSLTLPVDQYSSLLLLPTTLTTDMLMPLQPYVSYILECLVKSEAFHIIPSSDLCAFNPRQLPREIYVDSLSSESNTPTTSKKAGRPSKRDKAKKAKAALDGIDKWMHKTTVPVEGGSTAGASATTHYLLTQPPTQSLTEYKADKKIALEAIGFPSEGHSVVDQVNSEVLERLRQLEETEGPRLNTGGSTSFSGKERAERAVKEMKEKGGLGLLGLLEGSGLDATM
ncbi:hypothetical protein BT96DRAFT_873973 [Gymnopus androsaceus JB14]|uniref:Uncharacterized protein n=1 Tax=Gymnopus androsaceus JB14 TaxID=1447944 RepID=A0A6A4ICD5_9AGAR|nr:hypothetical protein BT96DRAFT_873973 [Gymnopus androsaceus JB14]